MKKLRDGFSVISAILIMVLISTVLVMSLSLSSKSVKQTTDVYLKAQAEILARSATEYALLAISGHDIAGTGNCLSTMTLNYRPRNNEITHIANISIMYIGDNLGCATSLGNGGDGISTAESNVTVIIDTVIRLGPTLLLNNEPIRIHRRTIQKP